ncbi:MAG: hypothetical protein AAFV95_09535 [Bacteroidota bacterium]
MNRQMKCSCTWLLLACLFLAAGQLQAQSKNLKKQLKEAELLFVKGEYAQAAERYENAWAQKKKQDYIYKAGECFLRMKDYRKAANAFAQVADAADQYPLAAFYQGRSLQQDGQYEAAKEAYDKFISQYKGANAGKRMILAQNAIEGCQLALKWNREATDTRIEIERLGEGVNTIASEFAPINFSGDVLYFSSTMKKGQSQLFRSQRRGGKWTPSVSPEFPSMPEGQLANGSFSSDQKRFYFSICRSDRAWQDNRSECDIYVISRKGRQWNKPEKLRDYIKMDGSTATQPFVVTVGQREYLYYVTDRTGGKGGLDIWYTHREINSEAYDFTLPQNAGPSINTPGDETTPFYDLQEKSLYFSSNGQASIGGLDIFKAQGQEDDWQDVVNIGMPYNSSADDYYFVKSPLNNSGFLVSNRIFGMDKIATTDTDIFAFGDVQDVPTIKGQLLAADGSPYEGVSILSLYERKSNGQKRLLQNMTIEGSSYTLNLIPNKSFELEATNDASAKTSISFNTFESGAGLGLEENLQFEQQTANPVATSLPEPASPSAKDAKSPSSDALASSTPRETTQVEQQMSERGSSQASDSPSNNDMATANDMANPRTSPANDTAPAASPKPRTRTAPRRPIATADNSSQERYIRDQRSRIIAIPEGIHYKIQFRTVLRYSATDPTYNSVKGLGRIDTEYHAEKNWTRVLLADYYSEEEAYEILQEVRSSGFPDAFLVKYDSGRRLLK